VYVFPATPLMCCTRRTMLGTQEAALGAQRGFFAFGRRADSRT
jgi:hypothetical protein